MKLNDIPTPVWWTISISAVALLAYRFILKPAATAAADAVNPTSDKNLANQAVNAAGAALTGDKDFSLGTAVYNFFHSDEGKDITGGPVAAKATYSHTAFGSPPNRNAQRPGISEGGK